jgi:hypothetical protein
MHGVAVRKYLHFIPAFSLVFVVYHHNTSFRHLTVMPSKTKHTSDNQAQEERTLTRATILGL